MVKAESLGIEGLTLIRAKGLYRYQSSICGFECITMSCHVIKCTD